jgi:hypothetical protein
MTRPKDFGGLGIPDLEKFGRALRLRWLWQDWTDDSKPWVVSGLPCSKDNRLLFKASTMIMIGDGAKAQFRHDNWLDGEAPKNHAPHMFELVRRKNRSVQQELHNGRWMHYLRNRVNTTEHMEEFVSLWIRIQAVHLPPCVRDSIIWRWTANGSYSTRSAYRIQSKDPVASSKTTSFGRLKQKINAKSS